MITRLVALRARLLRLLGAMSMYRLVLWALIALAVIAFVVSFSGQLAAQPLALALSAAVLIVSVGVVDVIGHLVLRRPIRVESGLITALILLFVLAPTTEPAGLGVLAAAVAVASASKYLLAFRARHLFNPAAFGAAIVTITGLGFSAWWVGTPLLAGAVVVLGVAVVLRAGQGRTALTFIVVAAAVSFAFTFVQAAQFSLAVDPVAAALQVLFSSPILFLGLFMMTEPLTLPVRSGWRIVEAVLVGVLVGWPGLLGAYLAPETALLLGNLLAFAVSVDRRRTLRLRVGSRRALSPEITELTLVPSRPLSFTPGQYLELEVPHRRADLRGTRREFSVVSEPGADDLRIAYRTPATGRVSTFKRALDDVAPGADLRATGITGSFTLPAETAQPVMLLGAGIGVTPLVSQLRADLSAAVRRDVVLVLVASSAAELIYVPELASTGARVIVVTPDDPGPLPEQWAWAGGARLDADGLSALVPDLGKRYAYVSGPPALIAALAPALRGARRVVTDAFAGY
ncbi:ferredoxin--NADP reductase [Microbacterium gorillae]|uniref:ferredoxin--NADP reductase n=1 Tax=Microbacterium gorillae TaxID=1231063 RepID=UPI00058E83C4|nr:hypothetical protein [Microbacterium gorillae]